MSDAQKLEKRVAALLLFHESGGFEGNDKGCTEIGHKAIASVMDERDLLRAEVTRLTAEINGYKDALAQAEGVIAELRGEA